MVLTPEELRRLRLDNREDTKIDPSIAKLRSEMVALGATMPIAEGVCISEIELSGVPGLKIVPGEVCARRTLLYFHGGGYTTGSAKTHQGFVSQLAVAMQATVWSMDYRLAPESPFPAGIEDGLAAYLELVAQSIDPNEILVAGDSAGAGLCLAAMLKARDHGLPMPAGLVLLSPWLDMVGSGQSYSACAESDPVVSAAALATMKTAYLDGADAEDPLASPVLAQLKRLPPILIQVGANEMLLSDSTTLAERAGLANVAVTLEIWPDMFHVFQAHYPRFKEARKAIARIGDWAAELSE